MNSDFAAALRDPARPCPAGLRGGADAETARRFAVYRNNVQASLIEALADTFPVCRALVGTDFFIGLAKAFLHACPPRSPVLIAYGDDFAGFIAGFSAASSLPYLADMARLERAYVMSAHAADAVPLTPAQLAQSFGRPELLQDARLEFDSALTVIHSDHAIVSLWSAHQEEAVEAALASVHPDSPETALLLRTGLVVRITAIPRATGALIQQLIEGIPLGAAAQHAIEQDPDFDLGQALGLLIAHHTLIQIHLPGVP